MPFKQPEVVLLLSKLSRRVMRFYLLDNTLLLDYDADERRASTRHKYRAVWEWHRLRGRGNTEGKRDVPSSVIEEALRQVRAQITYEKT